eukprot:SAG22_NODE_11895_length_464_cov_1.126027_1_plen_64_part_10
MIHETWLPDALAVAAAGAAGAVGVSVSAQMAADRSGLRLIVSNNRSAAVSIAAGSVRTDGWRAG